jgi:hypothetical protein
MDAPMIDSTMPTTVAAPALPSGEFRAGTGWSLIAAADRALFSGRGDGPWSEEEEDRYWDGIERLAERLRTRRVFVDYAWAHHGLGGDDLPTLEDVIDALIARGTPVLAPPILVGGWRPGGLGHIPDEPELRKAMQHAAAEEFRLEWGRHLDRWQLPDEARAAHVPALRLFLRSMWELTQEHLAALGVARLMAWRALRVTGRAAPFARVVLDQQPVNSFTTDFRTAITYLTDRLGSSSRDRADRAGRILCTDIPAERVLATPFTGFGEVASHELVVLSGPGHGWALTVVGLAEAQTVCSERNFRRLAERHERAGGRRRGAA